MENEEENPLLCPLIASWITIPASALFLFSLYYILDISTNLLYFLIFIFLLSFPLIAVLVTISYFIKSEKVYKLAYFISFFYFIISSILVIILVFGGFFYILFNLAKINLLKTMIKFIGLFLPFGLLISMLINVVNGYSYFSKKKSENIEKNIKEEMKNNSFDEEEVEKED